MKNFTKLSYPIIFFLFSAFSFGQVVTKTVDDGTSGTLRVEIANAGANGTVTFDSSIQGQPINITNGDIDINAFIGLTIDGNNGGVSTTLVGTSTNRIFDISTIIAGSVSINNIEFTNATSTSGGAVLVSDATTVVNFTDCVFTANTATGDAASEGGGAIYNNGATINFIGALTTFTNNTASGVSGSGGAIFNSNSGTVTINDATFNANNASRAGGAIEDNSGALGGLNIRTSQFTLNTTSANPGNGGAIHMTGAGNSVIDSSSFSNNTASNEGGALWNGSGLMTITDTTIDMNTASGSDAVTAGAAGGGGIYNEGGTVTTDATTVITNNIADGAQGTGGGVLNANGTFTATGSTISNNSSNRAGGGIEQNQVSITNLNNVTMNMNVTGVAVGAGAPGNGGALHVSQAGTVNITDGSYNQNTAANEGGALWNGSGAMNIMGSTLIDNNTASGEASMGAMNPGEAGGGGIYNEGGAIVITGNVTISNNNATGSTSTGGGVLVAGGSFDATGTTISSNGANRAGGGIEANSGGSVSLINVSLNGNTAGVTTGPGSPGNGGGLHISGASTVNVTGGTVNNNVAMSEGGGLWNGTGIMNIDGVTMDGNTASGPTAAEGGGAIYALNGGTVSVVNGSILTNNVANGTSGSGGAVLVDADASISIDGSTLNSNVANRAGGAIEIVAGSGTASLTNVTMNLNNAGVSPAVAAPGNGGALHITGLQDISIAGSTFVSNVAANEGGALWNGSGLMTITDSTIDMNTASGSDTMTAGAAGGGGIYNEGGDVTTDATTVITNNVADGAQGTGGGILVAAGSFDATGTAITGNGANRAGGGIEANGNAPISLTNVNLSNNTAGVVTGVGAPGNGGGLHVSGASAVSVIGGTVNNNIAMSEGGGLWNGTGTLIVDGVTLDGNTASGPTAAEGGGAIYALNGGTVSVVNGSILTNNVANGTSGSGGAVLVDADASISIDGCTLNSNVANRAGGAIEIVAGSGTASLTNVIMNLNNAGASPAVAAPGNGGALHISGNQDIVITNSTVSNNSAAREGGGLWNGSGLMTLTQVTINANIATGNAANQGGAGIFNNGGDITADGIIVTNNLAQGTSASGGAVLSTTGTISFTNSTFTGNSANRAGGAFEVIDGTLNISDSDVSSNDVNGTAGTPAPGNGGAIHITGATTTNISNSTFNNNEAGREGGALWNQNNSIMTVNTSTLDGNSAFGTDVTNDGGGAIFLNGGTVNVSGSTISNNMATANGGGIGNLNGTLNVTTSTISGNTAGANGGGIASTGPATTLNAVTVAQNNAITDAGGVGFASMNGATFTLKNTIVAENSSSNGVPNIGVSTGAFTSQGFNLIEIDDIADFTPIASDIVGTTAAPEFAALGPLQDNGGTTFTHALMNGTRAFDAGDSTDTFADQIGQTVFGTRDIGAFESQVTLSNEDFQNEAIASKIYPNPAIDGTVQLELSPSFQSDVTYQIIEMTGKTVAMRKATSGIQIINVESFSSGAYIIKLESNGKVENLRLIVK